MMGIEAARVGQHPHGGALEGFGLEANAGPRPAEPGAKRADAEHRDAAWTVAPDLGPEAPAAPPQLVGRKLIRRRAGPRYEIGDAEPEGQEALLLPGPQ